MQCDGLPILLWSIKILHIMIGKEREREREWNKGHSRHTHFLLFLWPVGKNYTSTANEQKDFCFLCCRLVNACNALLPFRLIGFFTFQLNGSDEIATDNVLVNSVCTVFFLFVPTFWAFVKYPVDHRIVSAHLFSKMSKNEFGEEKKKRKFLNV